MERVSTSRHFLGPTNEAFTSKTTPSNHSDDFYNPQTNPYRPLEVREAPKANEGGVPTRVGIREDEVPLTV